jgi:hypothetical protein
MFYPPNETKPIGSFRFSGAGFNSCGLKPAPLKCKNPIDPFLHEGINIPVFFFPIS